MTIEGPEPVYEERVTHAHVDESSVVGEPFGVAQVISLIVGIVFVVLGAVGLARSGIHALDRPAEYVGAFRATPLLSLIHLAIGIIALGSAAGRSAARGALMTLGPVLIAFGIVAIIQHIKTLGYVSANGVLYLIVGIVALGAAIATPNMLRSRRSVSTL